MNSFDLSPAAADALGGPDTQLRQAIARLVDLAGSSTGAPIAYLWLDDDHPAEPLLCSARPGPQLRRHVRQVVDTGGPVVLHDGYADLGAGEARGDRAVAFVGTPVARTDGVVLGALCVVDRRPRLWTTEEVATVGTLARAVAGELELAGLTR